MVIEDTCIAISQPINPIYALSVGAVKPRLVGPTRFSPSLTGASVLTPGYRAVMQSIELIARLASTR